LLASEGLGGWAWKIGFAEREKKQRGRGQRFLIARKLGERIGTEETSFSGDARYPVKGVIGAESAGGGTEKEVGTPAVAKSSSTAS